MKPTAHDHGNCELCDQQERDLAALRVLLERVRGAYRGHLTYRNTLEILADIDAALNPPPVQDSSV